MKKRLILGICCLMMASYGANPRFENMLFEMALHGQLNALRSLKLNPEEWLIKGAFSETLLHQASYSGNDKLVAYLIGKGLNVNAQDMFGRTPLCVAAEQGHGVIVSVLLSRGADGTIRDNQGITPLMWAASKFDSRALKALVRSGAKINAVDPKGRTAMDLVRFQHDNLKFTRLMADLGGKPGSHRREKGDLGRILRKQRKKNLKNAVRVTGYKLYSNSGFRIRKAEDDFFMAWASFINGDLEQSLKLLDNAEKNENRAHPRCIALRAEIMVKKRLYEEAEGLIHELNELNTLNSSMIELEMDLGRMAFHAGDYEFALPYFKSVQNRISSPPSDIFYFLGCIYDRSDKLDEARNMFNTYLNREPKGELSSATLSHLVDLKPSILAIRSLDGQRLDLDHFAGQYLLIDFWTADHTYKNTIFKNLEKIKKGLKKKPIVLISVNVDRDENPARDMVTWLNPSWPQYLDPGLRVARKAFGIQSVPALTLLNASGKLLETFQEEQISNPRKIVKTIKKQIP